MKSTEVVYGGINNQIAFTRFGFGSLPIGWYRRYVQQEDAVALVQSAYQNGVRLFDTSPLYGALRAEWILGKALNGIDRSTYTLASKVGYDVTGYAPDFVLAPYVIPRNYTYDFTMRSIEGSLKRLNTDYLDIVHIHDTEDGDDWNVIMNGAYRALSELKSQGVIKAIGFGNKYNSQMLRAMQEGEFDAFLCACRYSLLDHSEFLEKIQEQAAKKHIAIVAGGVLSSGIAANPYEERPMMDYVPATQAQIKKARDMDQICRKYGISLLQAALQFPAYNPVVKTVVVGCENIDMLKENQKDFEVEIPKEMWQELQKKGYVNEKAFVG